MYLTNEEWNKIKGFLFFAYSIYSERMEDNDDETFAYLYYDRKQREISDLLKKESDER